MKILRLSLNNLASLAGTHHIHFEQAPLAHAGLIAITGKTGAGKSTLLDAMCLALYNEVPRLKGAAGSLKDAGGQDISIKDSKNILRRGTTNGFAELEFIALDGKRYQARWEIRRARNKVDGNLKVERAITCLDDQRVLNQKISEATPIIEKLIGLSFEQFTRAVLLAQSEVGAFLKAKDHERADLLEYLTNSHIFSLVSIKSAEKFSQIKQQRAELENLIGHIEILSAEEIEQLLQQQKEFSLKLQNLNQSEKLLENEKKWHLDRHKLYADLHAKKEVYDVQLDAMNKAAPQQQLLEQLDVFQAIRNQFVQYAQLLPQKDKIQHQHTQFLAEFETLKTQVAHEQQQFKTLQQQQQQWQASFLSLKPQLEQGLKLDHDIEAISEQYKKLNAEQAQFQNQRLMPLEHQVHSAQLSVNQTQQQLQQIMNHLKDSDILSCFDQEPQAALQRMDAYNQSYSHIKQKFPAQIEVPLVDLQRSAEQLDQTIQQWMKQFGSLEQLENQVQTLRQKRQEQQERSTQLSHIQQQLQQLTEQSQEHRNNEIQLQEQQQQLLTLQQNEKSLEQEVSAQKAAYQQLEHIFEQQRLLHTQSVQDLRLQLKAGEPCMVCGSHDHPFAEQHELLGQNLHALQEQQLLQSKQQLETSLQTQLEQRIQSSKLAALIEQQQQRLLADQNYIQAQQKLITEKLAALNIQSLAQTLKDLSQCCKQEFELLQQEIKHVSDQEQSLSSSLNQWRQSSEQYNQLLLVKQQREQLEQLISPIQNALSAHYSASSVQSWLSPIRSQLQARIEHLKQYKVLEQQCQDHQQVLEKNQYQLLVEQNIYQELNQKLAHVIQQGKELRQQLADLTQNYAGKVYRVAAEWRQELEVEAKTLEQNLEQQRQHVQRTEAQLNQANLKLQAFVTQLQQIDQQLDAYQQAIQTWKLEHPSITQAMIDQWLSIDLTQHQQLRQNLNNQKQLLENAKTAWQLLEEQYQAHLKLKPEHEFEQIEEKLNTLVAEKSTLQDAFNELDAKLRMNASNQANYAKYQTQIEQIKAEEYRWGRIYDLIGHKEGTKFQKIAQEHHLDILVEYANQQLQPLAPRYQLHRIPDSLSLAIIDLDMNSEIRPVLSLSGGETFLVSLALALAIANMASGSMKLESLFIDEGFGTLDPASLHMVMNALDHLQSQGRKVVLISHVQEMHERIPVQIQVKPVGAGASRIEVVG
ncbi:hypothetical protein A3K93_02745 [Acinetobacter sp. NCu2D-2]|uniref:AAA family ATPase n=1 Tax=Acinetobacter sp. NCu2D-2 TaxID=1608473 RepID=UPI0007CDD3A0|nr:AAA family ATPase [Acinetobacter sp. NCu2D-2]ANF81219.1 hypothetical protein A3K93_02745 [Acinetobacter sp. NCu2D-2]